MKKTGSSNLTVVNGESFNEILDFYRLYLEALGRSNKTIFWYLGILKQYLAYLASIGLVKPINELGIPELTEYIIHLQQVTKWPNDPNIKKEKGGLSPFSIQGHVRAIKAFWSWLYKQGYVEINNLAKFPLPKVPKNIIKTLTIEQIKSLLKAIDKHTAVGFRNYCILLLLIDNGMRISEALCIQIADLDLQKCRVKITGKGNKERVVPFSSFTRKELLKYIKHYRPDLCNLDSPYLFPAGDGNHVSVNSIQQAIRRLAEKAGLYGIKCHAHIFRHTFATLFLAKGGSDMVLKEIMGHESLQTTQKYVHLQPEDLQKQHWKYSPVDDLFGE